MSLMLFLSDATARLVGVLGLVGTAAITHQAVSSYPASTESGVVFALMALWSLVKTLDFLWPARHKRKIARTQRFFPRLRFLIFTCAWMLVALGAMTETAETLELTPGGLFEQAHMGLGLFAMMTLFVVFFVLGLGYRAARAQMPEEARDAALTPPRQARRAEEHALRAQGVLRKHDIWDALLSLPFAAALILGFISLRSGTTVPTAQHAAWVEANMILIILGLAITAIVMQLAVAKRAPTTAMHARWSPGYRLLVMMGFGVPLLTGLMWYFGPLYALPFGWHLLTDQPVASVTYQVAGIRDGRRSSICVTLVPVDQPDHRVTSCGFDRQSAAGLAPGARLEAVGELSVFGHSLSQLRLTNAALSLP